MHYLGKAFDVRTRMMNEAQKQAAASKIRSRLGDAFDVIVHKTHIHVEFDPK